MEQPIIQRKYSLPLGKRLIDFICELKALRSK